MLRAKAEARAWALIAARVARRSCCIKVGRCSVVHGRNASLPLASSTIEVRAMSWFPVRRLKIASRKLPAAGQDGQGGGRPSELQTKLNPPRGAKTQTAGGGGDNQAPRGCLGACNAEPRSPSQPASHPLTLARRVVGQEGVRVRACVCVCEGPVQNVQDLYPPKELSSRWVVVVGRSPV